MSRFLVRVAVTVALSLGVLFALPAESSARTTSTYGSTHSTMGKKHSSGKSGVKKAKSKSGGKKAKGHSKKSGKA